MNSIIRMILRVVLWRGIMKAVQAFTRWRAQRQARKLNASLEETRQINAQARQQAQSTNRAMRILRRFTRF